MHEYNAKIQPWYCEVKSEICTIFLNDQKMKFGGHICIQNFSETFERF